MLDMDTHVHLAAGAILRLERGSCLAVQQGLVWATTTPAAGDEIVHAGESLAIHKRWPVVVQALAASEVTVTAGVAEVNASVFRRVRIARSGV